MTPTVSVLVTCYNLGAYLEEALDSVFEQTFQDFEVIVIDDGSTDPLTAEVMERCRRPRTQVYRIQNRGLPGARNEAARHARGRYFCALDADDLLEASWLEKAVGFLDARADLTFVSHWLRMFGDETGDWTPTRCDLEALLERNTINGAALVRAEAFSAVGGYDESMTDGCEDWDFWLTLVEQGFHGAIIPEVLFFYRRRQESMSRQMMRGDVHLRVFEGLVRKHERSYADHLRPLLVSYETELSRMRGQLHDRIVEDDWWLLTKARRSRQQLEWFRMKADRTERQIADRQTRQNLEDQLTGLRSELGHVSTELGASRTALEHVSTELGASRTALEHVSTELGASRTAEETLAQQLQHLQEENDGRRREQDQLSQSVAHMQEVVRDLSVDRQSLRQAVEELRASLSWRVTAPLRTLFDALHLRSWWRS